MQSVIGTSGIVDVCSIVQTIVWTLCRDIGLCVVPYQLDGFVWNLSLSSHAGLFSLRIEGHDDVVCTCFRNAIAQVVATRNPCVAVLYYLVLDGANGQFDVVPYLLVGAVFLLLHLVGLQRRIPLLSEESCLLRFHEPSCYDVDRLNLGNGHLPILCDTNGIGTGLQNDGSVAVLQLCLLIESRIIVTLFNSIAIFSEFCPVRICLSLFGSHLLCGICEVVWVCCAHFEDIGLSFFVELQLLHCCSVPIAVNHVDWGLDLCHRQCNL